MPATCKAQKLSLVAIASLASVLLYCSHLTITKDLRRIASSIREVAHHDLHFGPADAELNAILVPASAPACVSHSRGQQGSNSQEKVAVNREVLVCVSNSALITADGSYGILKLWLDGVNRAGVKNYLVIAIDDQLGDTLERLGVPHWKKQPKRTADGENTNHGISALKFQLIKEFLVLGYSVLLSDVDVLVLQNPFNFLHRDEDIEGMSDGFDLQTAYGYDHVHDDPEMGWSRWAHTFRIFALNSGLFYIRPNARTVALMNRVTQRLMAAKLWDQTVFNEEVWRPSSGSYKASHVTVRVMDIYQFVNTKTLFRTMRNEEAFHKRVPVMVHANYHPDKYDRLKAVWRRYVDNDSNALAKFMVGSCKVCPK